MASGRSADYNGRGQITWFARYLRKLSPDKSQKCENEMERGRKKRE